MYKGRLEGFLQEVVEKMLEHQETQTGIKDISLFEKYLWADDTHGGFTWSNTKEGYKFWEEVINNKNFSLFSEKYPKQDKNNMKIIGYKVKKAFPNFPEGSVFRLNEESGLCWWNMIPFTQETFDNYSEFFEPVYEELELKTMNL